MLRKTLVSGVSVACATLGGCGTLLPESERYEIAWQAVNVVDAAQTSQWRHSDCEETGAWREITGPEPSLRDTALAAGLTAGLHYAVSWALDRYGAPPGLKSAWRLTTIGLGAANVASNAALGCR